MQSVTAYESEAEPLRELAATFPTDKYITELHDVEGEYPELLVACKLHPDVRLEISVSPWRCAPRHTLTDSGKAVFLSYGRFPFWFDEIQYPKGAGLAIRETLKHLCSLHEGAAQSVN